MSANIPELRKEAYRQWGIGDKKVIYDFPRTTARTKRHEFCFRIDYSDQHQSWPRAYALALPNNDLELRVIVPVIIIKEYIHFTIESPVWYDMPGKIHGQLVSYIDNSTLTAKLPLWKKVCNRVLPNRYKFTDKIIIEDYRFAVSLYDDDIEVRFDN